MTTNTEVASADIYLIGVADADAVEDVFLDETLAITWRARGQYIPGGASLLLPEGAPVPQDRGAWEGLAWPHDDLAARAARDAEAWRVLRRAVRDIQDRAHTALHEDCGEGYTHSPQYRADLVARERDEVLVRVAAQAVATAGEEARRLVDAGERTPLLRLIDPAAFDAAGFGPVEVARSAKAEATLAFAAIRTGFPDDAVALIQRAAASMLLLAETVTHSPMPALAASIRKQDRADADVLAMVADVERAVVG